MAATGKTPILLYGSTTASNAPVAANLTNSADGCEIAINVADKNLFFKDSTNTVNTVPIRQSSASSNGWLSSTDWSTFNGKVSSQWTTTGSNIYYNTGNVGIGTGVDINANLDIYKTGSADFYLRTATVKLYAQANDSSTSALFGTISNHPLRIITNATDVARFFASGGVSIGNTTDPGATNLSVTGTITSGSTITGKSGSTIYSSAYTDNNFYLQQGTGQTTGNANILNFKDQSGTTAQIIGYGSAYGGGLNYAVRIVSGGSGGVQLTSGATSWASVSDERVKDIIEPIDNAVQRLSDWRSVIGKYETDPEGTRRTFLIAQDVLKTLPEVVDTGNPDEYSLRYQEIIPLLVAAINEQQATIESLNDRLTALENK